MMGFNKKHLPKQMDIVCLDSRRPFGNGYCIPRGILREPKEGLQRATHVLFTKGKPRSRALKQLDLVVGKKTKKMLFF